MGIFKATGRPSNVAEKLEIIRDFIVKNHPNYTVYIGISPFIFDSKEELISSMGVKGCLINSNGTIKQSGDADNVALSHALRIAFNREKKNPAINAIRLISDYARRCVKIRKGGTNE